MAVEEPIQLFSGERKDRMEEVERNPLGSAFLAEATNHSSEHILVQVMRGS